MTRASDELRRLRAALSMTLEPASTRALELLRGGDLAGVWAALLAGAHGAPTQARAAAADDGVDAALAARQWRFVVPGDEEWPAALQELAHVEPRHDVGGAPLGLWVRGEGSLAQMVALAVGIVGSRAATEYGTVVAADLAVGLARRGYTVVSGGAFGIDAAAHRGALAGRGPTICVLASGVDEPYPAANTGLIERIAADGLVVSEYAPGSHPTRVRFLARNRLIAALAAGTVLVEAAARSGARNTVAWAQELGRPVMAVPGPVTAPTSVTPHRLLRDQEASLVTCDDEIVELLSPLGQTTLFDAVGDTRPVDALNPVEAQVFDAIPSRGARSVEWVVLQTGLDWPTVAAALSRLEAARLVTRGDDGYRLGTREGSRTEERGQPIRLRTHQTRLPSQN